MKNNIYENPVEQVVQQPDKEFNPEFITFIEKAVADYDLKIFEAQVVLNRAKDTYSFTEQEGNPFLATEYKMQGYDDFNYKLFQKYVLNFESKEKN